MWRSLAPFSIIAFRNWCMFAMRRWLLVIRGRDPEDLAERGDPLAELPEGALPQGLHAEADRLALELQRRGAVQHELLQLLLELHHLVDGHPSLESRLRAVAAAPALDRHHLARGVRRDAGLDQLVRPQL